MMSQQQQSQPSYNQQVVAVSTPVFDSSQSHAEKAAHQMQAQSPQTQAQLQQKVIKIKRNKMNMQ